MPLQIKTQGFPSLIQELGIQSPLQGPFWGFEPTVIPIYAIGSNNVQAIAAMPYSAGDFASSVVVNPGLAQELVFSADLPAGRYGFQLDFHYQNTTSIPSAIDFLVLTNAGATQRVIPIHTIGHANFDSRYGQGHHTLVEDMSEGDRISVRNQTALSNAVVTSSLKWVLMNPLEFVPRF